MSLVRRERHSAEEAAVVDAAFLAEAPSKMFDAGAKLREACAALLRAKRGG